MNSFFRLCTFSLLLAVVLPAMAQDMETQEPSEEAAPEAQPMLDPNALESSFIQDNNGNGVFDILAFGDSITRGIGDFIAANTEVSSVPSSISGEAGYPLRVEGFLGIEVSNAGVPGERLVTEGVQRFASLVTAQRPDVVIIDEGSNDAIFLESATQVSRTLQTLINISYATNTQPILVTLTPTCCGRQGREPVIESFNDRIRDLARVNRIPLADVNRAFFSTCGGTNDCFLLNRPEGLHPNIEGYDVSGEVVTATLLGIDLLSPAGPEAFETALNLPAGSVRTVPIPVAAE